MSLGSRDRSLERPRLPLGLLRWLLAGAVAALAGWQLLPFLIQSPRALTAAGLVKDDAFFYGTLVNNFRAHGFFTMDGRMPTNGFQPLWMLVILGLKTIFPGADTMRLVLVASWASWVAFAFGVTWLVSGGAWHAALSRAALLGGLLLFNRRFALENVQGLEVAFALAVLAATLIVSERVFVCATCDYDPSGEAPRVSTRSAALLGALGALCFLGRTDWFWLVPPLAVWLWWLSDRRARPFVACTIAAAAIVIPYLLWNLIGHGALMPISGRAKLYFLHAFYPTSHAYWASEEWKGPFTLFGTWLPALSWPLSVAVSIALFALAHAVAWSGWARREVGGWLRALSVAVLLHALYMQFVYRELRPYTNYYFAPEALFVVLALALWIGAVPSRFARFALCAWLLVTSGAVWKQVAPRAQSYWTTRIAIARALPRLAAGRRVSAFWPGTFSWFSGLPITPLDGITGSGAFLHRYVETHREIDWALDHSIDLIVTAGGPWVIGPRPPPIGQWSELGELDLWARRRRFRVVTERGPWVVLEARRGRSSARSLIPPPNAPEH
jgi:hypothetical protein